MATRRPVPESEPEDTSGRTGCIAVGALLGVAGGVLFVFFGLSPLLNLFFGPTDVAAGQTFEGQGKTLRVVSVEQAPGFYLVTLSVTTNVTWALQPADFELELHGRDQRVKALPPAAGLPETSLAFRLAEERRLLLRFPAESASPPPVALHLRNPSLIFHLPAAQP